MNLSSYNFNLKPFTFSVISLFFSFVAQSQIQISEVMNTNIHTIFDSDFGEYGDWIELKNTSDTTVDLSNWYVGDLGDSLSWQFPEGVELPAGEFLLIWADGENKNIGETAIRSFTFEEEITITEFHSNFGLNNDNEAVYLFNSKRELIHKLKLPVVPYADVSVGTENGNAILIGMPTPKAENSMLYSGTTEQSEKPSLSIEGGKVNSGDMLAITSSHSSAKIYYTTDGSVPDTASIEYTEPITIQFPFVLKARVFENDKLPSAIATATYFTNDHDISVISVSADPEDIWGFDFGVHKRSYKDREVPVSIEMYNENGEHAFTEQAGMQLFGSQIFNLDQKPMGFYFRGKYGSSTLNYKLFDDKEISEFKHFVLRNGGNDNGMTMFRDGLVQTIGAGKLDYEYQSYKPAAVYLNGEYWGLYNIREKLNAESLIRTNGINPNRIDLIEDSLLVKEGDLNNYNAFLQFLESADMNAVQTYNELQNYMDVDQFIDYTILKIYAGYYIWDWNNKYWREKHKDGRWRWFIFDMEHSFLGPSGDLYSDNTLDKLLNPKDDKVPEWALFLLQKLFQNDQFKQDFSQRMAIHLHSTFSAQTVHNRIDSMQQNIANEMVNHINKWNSPNSMPVWQNHVFLLFEYAQKRPDYVQSHLQELFEIENTYSAEVNFDNKEGDVILHGVKLDSSYTGALYSGINTTLEAQPKPGYAFVGWENTNITDPKITLTLTSDTVFKAIFAPNAENILPSSIQSDVVLRKEGSPYLAINDIVIEKGGSLSIEEGVTVLMNTSAHILVYGRLETAGTEDEPVHITSYYEDEKWGAICAINADSPLIMDYTVLSNASYGPDKELYKAAVSSRETDIELSNITIPLAENPIYCYNAKAHINNCTVHSKSVCDLINLELCNYSIIEYCILKGNYSEDADALDIDNVNNIVIRNNIVSGFFGSNSDGIDLGGGTDNAYVEGNFIINCNDKGISIGSQAKVTVRNNIIVNCGQGIGLKDAGTYAYVDRNTFHQNEIGFACFEKVVGRGTGSADIVNCVFSDSKQSVYIENTDSVTVNYSLSTDTPLKGKENINAQPLYTNASAHDFTYLPQSPCINKGDPDSPLDEDNTRADMGAKQSYAPVKTQPVVISEIHYKSAEAYSLPDYIELYNNSDVAVDLSFWNIKDSNDENEFFIPYGTIIPAYGYIVVTENSDSLLAKKNIQAIGNMQFGLSRKSENIRLFDAEDNLVSSVKYRNISPWPKEADGLGTSIELVDFNADIQSPNNWQASTVLGGTPYEAPHQPENRDGIIINEVVTASDDSEDWIELLNTNASDLSIGGLYVTDREHYPTKHYIPLFDSVYAIIKAKGFSVLFATGDADSSVLHTNFKLSSRGEYLGLYQVINQDTILLDELTIPELDNGTSYGRDKETHANWGIMIPTPENPNNPFVDTGLDNVQTISLSPNPCSDFIYINLSEEGKLSIYSNQGKAVVKKQLQEGKNKIDLTGIGKGVYNVHIITNESTYSASFIK